MNLLGTVYLVLLFIAFIPGILFTLPKKGNKTSVLVVHAALFGLAWYVTHSMVPSSMEGFQQFRLRYNTVAQYDTEISRLERLINLRFFSDEVNRARTSVQAVETAQQIPVRQQNVANAELALQAIPDPNNPVLRGVAIQNAQHRMAMAQHRVNLANRWPGWMWWMNGEKNAAQNELNAARAEFARAMAPPTPSPAREAAQAALNRERQVLANALDTIARENARLLIPAVNAFKAEQARANDVVVLRTERQALLDARQNPSAVASPVCRNGVVVPNRNPFYPSQDKGTFWWNGTPSQSVYRQTSGPAVLPTDRRVTTYDAGRVITAGSRRTCDCTIPNNCRYWCACPDPCGTAPSGRYIPPPGPTNNGVCDLDYTDSSGQFPQHRNDYNRNDPTDPTRDIHGTSGLNATSPRPTAPQGNVVGTSFFIRP
jgi:hypothetical protein